jgi:hypothetical protein
MNGTRWQSQEQIDEARVRLSAARQLAEHIAADDVGPYAVEEVGAQIVALLKQSDRLLDTFVATSRRAALRLVAP